jgi:hypothetical protein
MFMLSFTDHAIVLSMFMLSFTDHAIVLSMFMLSLVFNANFSNISAISWHVLDKDYYLHPTHIICSCHDFDSLEQYFLVD